MTDLNFDPITAVVKAIASMAIAPVKNQLERNEKIIQLRKMLDLPPDHPPADFTAVYQYALVDYGVDKPQALLEIFRQKEIIQVFRQAFEQKDQSILLEEGENFLSWNVLGDRIHELDVDIRKEFTDFQSVFIKVASSTRTPADVIQIQKIDSLEEMLGEISIRLLASQSHWSRYISRYGLEGLVSFEIENSPALFGVAEPDDTGRQEILLGQGFRLVYQLPFAGYALLIQEIKASWVITRFGKCEDSTLDREARYIQERIAVVPVGEWSVPTNRSYLREKTDVGLHRFVLLLSQHPFPVKIQELLVQETSEISASTLSNLVEYIDNNALNIKLIVAECEIISSN
jgi:hypothetical protein